MNVVIFNRHCWVRRFEEQREFLGYLVSGRLDFVADLHVHPGSDQVTTNPEGERRLMRLEGHGTDRLLTAEQSAARKGDLLLYQGRWFECTSALLYDHTVLNHWNYSFVEVPADSSGTPDTADPPQEDPALKKPGEGLFTPDPDITGDGELSLVKVPAGSGLKVDAAGFLSVDAETAEELRRILEKGGGGS